MCGSGWSLAAVLRVHSEQWFPLQHNGGSVSVCCFRARASPPEPFVLVSFTIEHAETAARVLTCR